MALDDIGRWLAERYPQPYPQGESFLFARGHSFDSAGRSRLCSIAQNDFPAGYIFSPAWNRTIALMDQPSSDRPFITSAQANAAMTAMLQRAMRHPIRPVAMAIVDDSGALLAYRQMDRLRLFTRRHAIRKAYTAAITGMNSGAFGQDCLKARGFTVREIGGDLELTPGAGGVVVRSTRHTPQNPEQFHVNVIGGIGVGGYLSGSEDEELALVGLDAMGLR